MGLPAMMGLMIEQMHKNIREKLRLRHSRGRLVAVQTSQCGVIVFIDNRDQPVILRDPRSRQFGAVFVKDGVKMIRMVALTGQPLQPEAIGQQQMI